MRVRFAKQKLFLAIILCLATTVLFSQKINTPLTYSVHTPATKTKNGPVLIVLHGYAADENDLFKMAKELNPAFTVFSLRGPVASGGDGFCWYKIERLPQGKFKYDYKEVENSRNLILSFISNACKVHQLDSKQVYVAGFSQGAIMSFELALFAPSKIKGIIALSGRLMDESKTHKPAQVDFAKQVYFIAHGSNDKMIDCSESEKALAYLESRHAPNVVYNRYPITHTISTEELSALKTWLGQNLKP